MRTVRWSWLVSWVVVFVSGSPARAASLFEDPVLQGLLADAEKHRPELARAHAEITASRERALQASVLPDPTLAFGIQNDGFRSIQIGRMETSWLYFIGSQTLPWFGKRALRQELADTEAKRDGAALGRATLSLRAEIARAYLDLLLARDQLALLAKLDALWRQSEGTARARYETGEGAQSDLLRAQLERSRLRLRSITASAEESRRLELLNSLRGAPAETGLATTVHLVDLADPPLPSWEDALGEAERRSPELRRARIEGEVARNARSLAGRELLPDITVTAGVMPRGGLAPMWQAGLALSLPVWSRGRQPHLLNERASLEARAGAEQDDLRRRLAARVRERLRLLKAASESHALYRGGLLIQSAATVTSSLAQYRVGRVPFSAVLEAIASHINDEESFLQSIVGAHRVAIGLEEVSLEEPAAGGALGGASATMSARPVLETAPVVSPGRGAMVGGM